MAKRKTLQQQPQQPTTPPPPKRRTGRPPVSSRIDYAEVERLAAMGLTDLQISKGLGIGYSTARDQKVVNRAFQAAYEAGRHKARQRALASITGWAQKNPIASIFQAKHLLGWHDQQMGGYGRPAELRIVIESRTLSDGKPEPIVVNAQPQLDE